MKGRGKTLLGALVFAISFALVAGPSVAARSVGAKDSARQARAEKKSARKAKQKARKQAKIQARKARDREAARSVAPMRLPSAVVALQPLPPPPPPAPPRVIETPGTTLPLESEPEPAATDAAGPRPTIVTLGEGSARLHLVDHGDAWSMHAESLVTSELFYHWHTVGGPEVIAKVLLDRPFTLSVHRVKTERLIERLLEGFGYTLHYDAKGRLATVRVYSPEAALSFKTPRLTQSLGAWRENEESAFAAQ